MRSTTAVDFSSIPHDVSPTKEATTTAAAATTTTTTRGLPSTTFPFNSGKQQHQRQFIFNNVSCAVIHA